MMKYKVIHKPWGSYKQFCENEKVTVKIHSIKKGETSSYQTHHKRSELWIPLTTGLMIQIDGKTSSPRKWKRIFIKKGIPHRFYASKNNVSVLEICFGTYHDNDIVRHFDKYGRETKKHRHGIWFWRNK